MSYTIRRFDKTNTTPALIVKDKKVDNTSTTLSFYGLNSADFGLGLNENYLHLMENFCNRDISLAKVVPGQLWFDASIKKMKIWNGSRWHILKEYTTNKQPKGFVTIVGNLVNGSTVSTENTLYDEDGMGDFSYQWYLDAIKISGATSPTYTILLSDVGHNLAVSLRYIDGSHNSETVYSKQYPINSAANHLPTGTLSIDGIIEIDEYVTATIDNIQDSDGYIGGNFGWLLDGVDIPGANGSSYQIRFSDAGSTLKAKYYFVDLNNNNEVIYSNSVVVPYAVTTTTQEPTTTTTQEPTTTTTQEPTTTTTLPGTTTTTLPYPTTTTTTRPDTSALDAQITLCNATVPILNTLWFQAETDRIATEQALATAVKSSGDDIDSLPRRIALRNADTAAINKINTTYTNWLNGINSCISNKQDLFNLLQDKSSALSLTQAYQSKMEIHKSSIDNAIALYTTTVNDYSAQIEKDTSDNFSNTLASRIELENLSEAAWSHVSKYQTAWNTTFSNATAANIDMITTFNDTGSVATITALSQYKTTTLKDIYDKLKVISDAAGAKYASVDGNTNISLSARIQWRDLSVTMSSHTTSAQKAWIKSVTDGVALNASAQNMLT